MGLADIRRMQRKRRSICDSSEVECDGYDESSRPSGLENYLDYDCPFGYRDWEETNHLSGNTKRRKSMRSIPVRSEGCRRQR